MLDPDYLERAGDLVASVYSEIEAEMCDELVQAMLEGDLTMWQARIALANLSQDQATALRAILEHHREDVDRAVRKEVEDALRRSDRHDLDILKRALGVELPAITNDQVALVCRTVTEMLGRDNIAMLGGAREAFYREGSWAIMQTATGHMGHDEAVRQATRNLARRGIDMIQYRDPTTGDKTVRNHADVAVRRHVRSQIAQESASRTALLCQQAGCEFYEVSSHYGARPSHQDWEGRVYHVGGRITVDGTTYEDFGEATGYYGTGDHAALGDRLCGVNCRHHFGPWAPGIPRAYQPNQKHPSGRSNDEIYKLTQTQRRMERNIRATKREYAAALRAYQQSPTPETQATANQLKNRLHKQQDALKKLVADNKDVLTWEPRREWAGDMPRVSVPSTREGGAVAGAIRGDPVREEQHAARYYESARKMDRQTVLEAIATGSGLTIEESERAFSHLMIERHELESGLERFAPDYEMSQSMQRLLLGRDIQEHDRLMFPHELVESIYMARGIPQRQAHRMANMLYNYEDALDDWLNGME